MVRLAAIIIYRTACWCGSDEQADTVPRPASGLKISIAQCVAPSQTEKPRAVELYQPAERSALVGRDLKPSWPALCRPSPASFDTLVAAAKGHSFRRLALTPKPRHAHPASPIRLQ
jgi:hypothetical protein